MPTQPYLDNVYCLVFSLQTSQLYNLQGFAVPDLEEVNNICLEIDSQELDKMFMIHHAISLGHTF